MRVRCGFAPARDRVHFVGFRDDVQELLAGLDLLVAPSRREALSLTLIEAAAAGVPTVASRIGGIPEVILDGETGILVAPEDPASLARAIESLIRDPVLRARLASGARAGYEHDFTMDNARRHRGGLSQSAPCTALAGPCTVRLIGLGYGTRTGRGRPEPALELQAAVASGQAIALDPMFQPINRAGCRWPPKNP